MRCWDEHLWWIIIWLMDYSTFPCHDWVSGHSDLRTDVVILAICRAIIDAQSCISVFSLDWCWFRWIVCIFMTQLIYLVLWLSLLLYSFLWHVLSFGVMDLVVIYMDLDVWVLCIDVLTETQNFLIYTHWFYPPQGE